MSDNNFTPEDGAEFANLLGINGDNTESEGEDPQDDLETDGEEADASESEQEPDNSSEEEEETQKPVEAPKKKS